MLLAARDEGVRRVVDASSSSVYGNTGTAPAHRVAGPGPDLAVRGREARRGALLHQLQPRLRHRDRRRCATSTSSGPRQDPTSQYAAVVPRFITRDRGRRAGDDLRRRRAVARLHVRRQRRRARTCSAADAEGVERRDPQRRDRRVRHRQRPRGRDRAAPRQAGRAGPTSRRGRRRAGVVGRRRRGTSLLGFEPRGRLRGRPTTDADYLLDERSRSMGTRFGVARRARRGLRLPQGPQAARRDRVRRQRDRLSPRLRGVPPLPRHPGRALLRPLGTSPASRWTARSGSSGRAACCHVESTTPRKVSNASDDDDS